MGPGEELVVGLALVEAVVELADQLAAEASESGVVVVSGCASAVVERSRAS